MNPNVYISYLLLLNTEKSKISLSVELSIFNSVHMMREKYKRLRVYEIEQVWATYSPRDFFEFLKQYKNEKKNNEDTKWICE